jgi:DNA-binding protein YbaB
MAEFEQIKAQAEATVKRFEQMSAEVGADAVEMYSEDRLLRVRLDANGNVEEIAIEELAMRNKQMLGRMMVALIAEARVEHAERQAEMARRMIGDKFDIDAIMSRFAPKDGGPRA